MLVAEEPPGAAEPCLHLVADEQRAVIVHERTGGGEEPARRDMDALALFTVASLPAVSARH